MARKQHIPEPDAMTTPLHGATPEQNLWARAVDQLLYDWTRLHVIRHKRKLTCHEREHLRDAHDAIFEEPVEESSLYHMLDAVTFGEPEAAVERVRRVLFNNPLALIKRFPSLLDARFWN